MGNMNVIWVSAANSGPSYGEHRRTVVERHSESDVERKLMFAKRMMVLQYEATKDGNKNV